MLGVELRNSPAAAGAGTMSVLRSTWSFAASMLICGFAPPAIAADPPCTCPDMLDLASRNNQVKAAIRTYQEQLAAWTSAGGAPGADEAARISLQREIVEPPMAEAKDYRANVASARTLADCSTTFDAPTACLRVLMEKHEQVHAAACRAHAAEHVSVTDVIVARWQTLADYAREEIAGYEAERSYIETALSKLENDCRYTLEFDSTIAGATEATRSDAKTRVDLEVHFPRGYNPTGLTGAHPLNYNTRDVGPPKIVGDPMLSKLAIACYAASQGSGNVSFEVRDAWLMRERTPPYGPLLELPIFVGDTQETRRLKGPRGCPRESEQRSFWTDQFKLGKRIEPSRPASIRDSAPSVSGLAVIIDSWTFSGEDAEKTIETACAGFSGLEGLPGFSGLPTGNVMCEKTVLKLKRKH
jgi:hypothetical protein